MEQLELPKEVLPLIGLKCVHCDGVGLTKINRTQYVFCTVCGGKGRKMVENWRSVFREGKTSV